MRGLAMKIVVRMEQREGKREVCRCEKEAAWLDSQK